MILGEGAHQMLWYWQSDLEVWPIGHQSSRIGDESLYNQNIKDNAMQKKSKVDTVNKAEQKPDSIPPPLKSRLRKRTAPVATEVLKDVIIESDGDVEGPGEESGEAEIEQEGESSDDDNANGGKGPKKSSSTTRMRSKRKRDEVRGWKAVARMSKSIIKPNATNEQADALLFLLEDGFRNQEVERKLKILKTVIDDNFKEQFKAWIQGAPKSELIRGHSTQDLVQLGLLIIEEDHQWLKANQFAFSKMIFDSTLDCIDIELLAKDVTLALREQLRLSLRLYGEIRDQVNWQHLVFALELGLLDDLLKSALPKFGYQPNEVAKQLAKKTPPQQTDCCTHHYVYCFQRKYYNLGEDVISAVLADVPRLCHPALLTQLSLQIEKLQGFVLKLFDKGIRGGEGQSLATGTIIEIVTTDLELCIKLIDAANKGGTISATEMAILCEQLATASKEQVEVILGKGLQSGAKNAELVLRQTSSVKFDSEQINTFYSRETQSISEQVKQVVNQIAKDFQTGNRKYLTNKYQSAIAMRLIDLNSQCVGSLVMPGDGKTFILLKIAQYYALSKQPVFIVVTNSLLYKQMSRYVQEYCDTEYVKTVEIIDLTVKISTGSILLIDEADLALEQFSVVFAKQKQNLSINGFVTAVLAKKVILLSASFANFHQQYAKHVLKMQDKDLLKFKSLFSLHSGEQVDPDCAITRTLVDSQSSAAKVLLDLLNDSYQSNPALVFVCNDQTAFDSAIKKFCSERAIQFSTIESAEEAIEVSASMSRESQGVIRIGREFARGFDIKLAKDARVIIIANDDTLCYIEVFQMVGRGCRTQGKAEGRVIMQSEKTIKESVAWQAIKSREKNLLSESVLNLVRLAECIGDIKSALIKKIQPAFQDNEWQASNKDFYERNEKVIKLLDELTSQSKIERVK